MTDCDHLIDRLAAIHVAVSKHFQEHCRFLKEGQVLHVRYRKWICDRHDELVAVPLHDQPFTFDVLHCHAVKDAALEDESLVDAGFGMDVMIDGTPWHIGSIEDTKGVLIWATRDGKEMLRTPKRAVGPDQFEGVCRLPIMKHYELALNMVQPVVGHA